MFEKNSFSIGIIAGLVLPALGGALIFGIFEALEALGWMSSKGFRPMFRERTSAIVGIALNAIPLNYYSKLKYHNSVRGVVVMTTVWVVVWMVVFGKHVL